MSYLNSKIQTFSSAFDQLPEYILEIKTEIRRSIQYGNENPYYTIREFVDSELDKEYDIIMRQLENCLNPLSRFSYNVLSKEIDQKLTDKLRTQVRILASRKQYRIETKDKIRRTRNDVKAF